MLVCCLFVKLNKVYMIFFVVKVLVKNILLHGENWARHFKVRFRLKKKLQKLLVDLPGRGLL